MIIFSLQNDGSKPKRKISRLQQFARKEDGTFTIFTLLILILMLAITGMAMDLMTYERDRASLQSTLDRAVLAAADLDQKLPPKDVVDAYMEKAGLGHLEKTVTVTEGFGSRKVAATANAVVPTRFMRFGKVTELNMKAASTAIESIGSVEISLVLDMSGSMRWSSATAGKSKIDVLKTAAKGFVTKMLEESGETKISMSIVPYATQVNAGQDILGKFTNVTSEHNYSHCVNFSSGQFGSATLDPTAFYQRTGHFDPWRYTQATVNGRTTDGEPPAYFVCPVRTGSEITAVTDNVQYLHNRIDALTASGNTSIDVGMKWGVGILDPSFQPVINALATENKVPAKFANRPESYDSDVLKVVIVMTDGQNTTQYMLDPSARSGQTDVWFNPEFEREDGSKGEYSVRYYHDPQGNNPDRWVWMQHTKEKGSYVTAEHPFGNPPNENPANEEVGTATRLSYPELFNRTSLWWNAKKNFYWQSNHENTWYYGLRKSVGSSTKNARTASICGAAKDKGVIIYGIAFEAPTSGLNTIKSCASSDSHVHNVAGLDLDKAFTAIASSIRKLRLTQ
ncbi:pilus assembly protein TadG-related protein [Ruegeria marisrubri]|uniref:Tad domain-containing protein n=1 Tax=Ruegeria marisrubri TaxID=1685379 RepID=UPI001CD80FA7|nr:Tad domain-containing protein [Ruegeria marisrubri]MCA0906154.1 pilus assembly protein TadG-related protein [Ruegeria marisrubri]